MRLPAVAGTFYPSGKEILLSILRSFFGTAKPASSDCLALICPHAGYAYSGKTAAFSYAAAKNLESEDLTVIFIGPNHTGAGDLISISEEDWMTPLGISRCDTELATDIFNSSNLASMDDDAHVSEHSIEVQLPFLQHINPSAKIVCICMMGQDLDASRDIGKAIFEASKGKNVLVIASSDFTHYETAEKASALDAGAMERIQVLDDAGFQKKVEERGLSICGHGPIAAALHYSKLCGAKTAELLKYTNSGEETGDMQSVVAYASFAIRK